jgi:hypothetical protein
MDKFTQAAAAHHLVEAYKKVSAEYLALRPLDVTISDDAPETYEALVADAAEGKLRISPANSGATIYGHAGNMAFRTMHDLGHLMYRLEFTLADEVLLATNQWLDLKVYIPAEFVGVCHDLYFADTVKQSLYCDRTGEFPRDQIAFVRHCLTKNWATYPVGA